MGEVESLYISMPKSYEKRLNSVRTHWAQFRHMTSWNGLTIPRKSNLKTSIVYSNLLRFRKWMDISYLIPWYSSLYFELLSKYRIQVPRKSEKVSIASVKSFNSSIQSKNVSLITYMFHVGAYFIAMKTPAELSTHVKIGFFHVLCIHSQSGCYEFPGLI